MSDKSKWDLLKQPFHASELEWRIGQDGKTRDGKIWAKCFAYVTNRAIQHRLDDVIGPENWCNEYRHIETSGKHGVLCGISILMDDGKWITKWDGAENTDFEPLKGGLSDSMKRAAVQWGIGRYLYDIEEGWAEIVESRTPGSRYQSANAKNDMPGYNWLPPRLGENFLPASAKGQGPSTTTPQPPPEREQAPRQQPKSEKPACPKCGAKDAVRAARDKDEWYCWKKLETELLDDDGNQKKGCGHVWPRTEQKTLPAVQPASDLPNIADVIAGKSVLQRAMEAIGECDHFLKNDKGPGLVELSKAVADRFADKQLGKVDFNELNRLLVTRAIKICKTQDDFDFATDFLAGLKKEMRLLDKRGGDNANDISDYSDAILRLETARAAVTSVNDMREAF